MSQTARKARARAQSAIGQNAQNPLGEAQVPILPNLAFLLPELKRQERQFAIGQPAAILLFGSAYAIASKATKPEDLSDLACAARALSQFLTAYGV